MPTYRVGNEDYQYYYWYEWEIESVDGWGNGSRDKFDGNVYLYSDGNKGRSYTSYMTDRMTLVYVEPKLNWSNTFTMRVSVRARLSKTGFSGKAYTAKSGVNVYENNGSKNEILTTISSGTALWTNLDNFDKWNGTSVWNYNWEQHYVDTADVAIRLKRPNNNINYSNDGTNYYAQLSPAHVTSIDFNRYESGKNYPIRARVYFDNRNPVSLWLPLSNDIIDSFYANKDTPVYRYLIVNNGNKNSIVYTCSGGEKITILGDISENPLHVRINGHEGYIDRWNTMDETDAEPDFSEIPYYRLPETQKATYDMEDITTTDKSAAYVSSKLVTINPVKLTLTPVETQFYKHNTTKQTKLTAYFNTNDTVYLGKGVKVDNIGYNATEDYRYYNVVRSSGGIYSGYKLDNKNPNDGEVTWYCDYYKCFTPSFTGIKVDRSNYSAVLGNVRKTLDGSGTSALQPYVYDSTTGTTPQNLATTEFDSGYIFNVDNQLYFYVKMTPYYWGRLYTTFPSGVRWTCVVEGKDSANYVKANTVNGEYYYFNYTANKELDPTATN